MLIVPVRALPSVAAMEKEKRSATQMSGHGCVSRFDGFKFVFL
jgi:hypothetical protein